MTQFKPLLYALSFVFLFSSAAVCKDLLVVYPDWVPYYYEENGEFKGFEAEIFRETMKIMGIHATYKQYPWKRCLVMIENGDADVTLSALVLEERKQFMYYPDENMSIDANAFVIKKEDEGKITFDGDFAKLRHYRIGIGLGYSFGDSFDNAGLQLDPAPSTESLFEKLLKGRTQLIAENYLTIRESAKKLNILDQIVVLEPYFSIGKLYAGFSKKTNTENFVKEFSDALAQFKNTETYHEIVKKYGAKE